MDNTYLTQILPYLIRIAAILLIVFSITDYVKRKKANLIVKALTETGADSAENAVTLASLEETYPRITKCQSLLDEFSSLRRIVLSTEDETEENTKKKSIFSKKTRLTGEERWYIPAPVPVSEDEEENAETNTPVTPAILRLGGETSVGKIVFGAVVTVIFGEIIIYFLPQILNFFTDLNSFGKN